MSSINSNCCMQLVPYLNNSNSLREGFLNESLDLQKKEAEKLKCISLRVLFSNGIFPRPEFDKACPPLISLSKDHVSQLIEDTVHETINSMDYNGLQPFLKFIEHLKLNKPISELYLDSSFEYPSTTCVGMTNALLCAIKVRHKLNGVLVAQRKKGHFGFMHACALIYCSDGFVLIDPVSDRLKRIWQLPYESTTLKKDRIFITKKHIDLIPIIEIRDNLSIEYCANIANASDLILKHYIAEEPFLNASNPAFPISTYNKDGTPSKCIWISIINETLTLKNMTYSKQDIRRTSEVDLEEIEDDDLRKELKKLYDAGKPTFKIPFSLLFKKLKTFVDNIDLVKKVFSSAIH